MKVVVHNLILILSSESGTGHTQVPYLVGGRVVPHALRYGVKLCPSGLMSHVSYQPINLGEARRIITSASTPARYPDDVLVYQPRIKSSTLHGLSRSLVSYARCTCSHSYLTIERRCEATSYNGTSRIPNCSCSLATHHCPQLGA
jgi:hypothetical protein